MSEGASLDGLAHAHAPEKERRDRSLLTFSFQPVHLAEAA